MIEAKGVFQSSDYVRAQYLHTRPRPVYKVLGAIVLALFLWAAWHSLTSGDFGVFDLLFLATAVLLILNFTVYLPWKTRRIYRQQKALQRELAYKFDDDGVSVTNENGQSLTPWDDYLKWKQNDNLILLYLSDCMYHMLPNRFFSNANEVDGLREILRSRIGKEGR